MSYCRWSSNNYQCDVYVYESDLGFQTYVAGNRVNWDTHDRVFIDHPEAGQSYTDTTPGQCADRLEKLKSEGFKVPQYAIDELRKEETGTDAARI